MLITAAAEEMVKVFFKNLVDLPVNNLIFFKYETGRIAIRRRMIGNFRFLHLRTYQVDLFFLETW